MSSAPAASPSLSRKTQIERTATVLFSSRGFVATSMRELATAMGLEAGSLYSHVKSKEELLQGICFNLAETFLRNFHEAAAADGRSVATRLRRAIETHVWVLTQDVEASSVFLHEWRHLSEPDRTRFMQLREEYETGFRQLLQQGLDAGELHAPDAAFATLTLLASINWVPSWYKSYGKLSADEIAHRLAEQLLYGLSRSQP